MTRDILLTIGVMVGALALFVSNKLRVDVVGGIVMATLIVIGLVTPQEGISGFANEATVTVAFMLILSAGLLRTGAIDVVGRWVARLAGKSEVRLLAVVIMVVVPLSAFINNTAAVIILMPMVLGLCRENAIAPSRILMPLSFAGQMGGTLTLIGTSTNLLVAGLLLDFGMDRIRLFDITPPAMVLTGIGVAYLMTVGRWLTPERHSGQGLMESYELREYLTTLVVANDSRLAGKTLAESRFGEVYKLQVVEIRRDTARISPPSGSTVIKPGDVLRVRGKIPDIAQMQEVEHLSILDAQSQEEVPPVERAGEPPAAGELLASSESLPMAAEASASSAAPSAALQSGAPALPLDPDQTIERRRDDGNAEDRLPKLAEIIVPPRSRVIGRTLRELEFRVRYHATAIGVQRQGQAIHEPLRDLRLMSGDLLLIQADRYALSRMHESPDFALLGAVRLPLKRRRKMRIAVLIMLGVVLLPAFDMMPIMVSALLGVLGMFLSGCITPREAYEEMDWSVIVLLGTIIPLGIAMRNTGTAEYIAAAMLGLTAPLGIYGTLASMYVLTSLLTEMISNNAAAVVLTPLAIATAAGLGVSPLPFVIAVMLAASNSFMSPIGYQTNTFIFGPGGYRFTDFARVGGLLNILLIIAATIVIPIFFPF